jgi:hypothetical protein
VCHLCLVFRESSHSEVGGLPKSFSSSPHHEGYNYDSKRLFASQALRMSGSTAAPADADPSSPVLLQSMESKWCGLIATTSFVQSFSEPPRAPLLAASVPGLRFIEVWDTRTGTLVANLEGPATILSHAAYELPDHRPRIFAGDKNGAFVIFDGASFTKVHQGHLGGIGVRSCYVYKTLDGDWPRIVSGHGDGRVTVLDGETGELIRRVGQRSLAPAPEVVALAGFDHPTLLEHRTVVASGGRVWVFCPEGDGEILMTLEVPHPPILRLACFEPSHAPGRFCVAACTYQAAWVWEEGALMHRFQTEDRQALQTEDDKEKILDMTVSGGDDTWVHLGPGMRMTVGPWATVCPLYGHSLGLSAPPLGCQVSPIRTTFLLLDLLLETRP